MVNMTSILIVHSCRSVNIDNFQLKHETIKDEIGE